MFRDHAPIPIRCPECGGMNTTTIGWFRERPDSFICRYCAACIPFAPGEIDRFVEALERINERIRRDRRGLAG